ncbi:MAG: hypothetical protein HKN25_18290 [Pyrinomonadaceae bacterium]|nr:hypothetical protein [Pyrinomonadaceae bacterium]
MMAQTRRTIVQKNLVVSLTLLIFSCALFTPHAEARGKEFDAVCKHIKTRYKAKKVKIPFMWLARAAVGIVRPAGVKSFKVTIFRNLDFSSDTLHSEMKTVMSNAFSPDWSPILRIRSRHGEQIYMNMRESGKNVKILAVKIERDEAIVVRAKFNPDKLVKFMENPKIFGIALNDVNFKGGDSTKKISDKDDRIIYEDDETDEDQQK